MHRCSHPCGAGAGRSARPGRGPRRQAQGFTLVFVLAATAALLVSLAAAGSAWSTQQQRQREQALLRVAQAWLAALRSYAAASPGTLKQYPRSVDELLRDPRLLTLRRHLRAPYGDPLRPGQPLELLRDAEGRIRGVRSASPLRPLQRGGFAIEGVVLAADVERYADWQFVLGDPPR